MHPTYAAAVHVANVSFALFDAVLVGLPDAAVTWTPLPDANSLATLVRHSVTATRFQLEGAAGKRPSRSAYAETRAEAFRTQGMTIAGLRAELSALLAGIPALFEGSGDADLAAEMEWPEDDGRHATGAEYLMRAFAHFREHVGQAELMRDLWRAANP